jgi:hypothetical protein
MRESIASTGTPESQSLLLRRARVRPAQGRVKARSAERPSWRTPITPRRTIQGTRRRSADVPAMRVPSRSNTAAGLTRDVPPDRGPGPR